MKLLLQVVLRFCPAVFVKLLMRIEADPETAAFVTRVHVVPLSSLMIKPEVPGKDNGSSKLSMYGMADVLGPATLMIDVCVIESLPVALLTTNVAE